MAERTSVSQVVNVGVEATPGTLVAATRRLQTISIDPAPEVNTEQFRPGGYRLPTISQITREHVEADIDGQPSYNEIVYLLSSLLGAATITSPDATNAPSARQWDWDVPSTAEAVPVTFTVEHGSAFRAHRFGYGVVSDLSFSLSRDGFEVSGGLFGRRLEDGVVLTAGATETEAIPIQPTQFDVYVDTSGAGLGTTKLGRLLSLDCELSSKYAPFYVVDRAQPSFAAHVETPIDGSVTLTMEADADGMALLSRLRDQATRFVRLEAIGPNVGGAVNRTLLLDFAVKITDSGGFSDEDGVYAVEWDCEIVHDSTWGRGFDARVINTLSAL